MIIKEIYRVNFMKNKFSYSGTLRNENKFELNEDIFFVIKDNEITKGRIIGIELSVDENPEYKYKIQLSEELLRDNLVGFDTMFNSGGYSDDVWLNCDKIFRNVHLAHVSAIKQLDAMYDLQKKEIEHYFNQFNNEKENKEMPKL